MGALSRGWTGRHVSGPSATRLSCTDYAGLQSDLGWGSQRLGDALAQAAAPAEGGSGAQQGQGAGGGG
jgi:hypothetical protein